MGRLEVRVCGARSIGDLQKVSLPDPYVKVKLNSYYDAKKKKDELRFKTRVIDNNLNPVWDELFKLQIADYDGQQVLFEVWNDNVFKDDMLGVYRLSLNGLTRGIMQDVWVILSDTKLTSPELHLRILAVDFGRDPDPGQPTYASIEAAEAATQVVVSDVHKKGKTGGQNTMTEVGGFAGQQQMQHQIAQGQPLQYNQQLLQQPSPQPQPQQVVYVQSPPPPPQQQQPNVVYIQQAAPQQQPQVVYMPYQQPPPPQQVYYQQMPPPPPQQQYYQQMPPQPFYGAYPQ